MQLLNYNIQLQWMLYSFGDGRAFGMACLETYLAILLAIMLVEYWWLSQHTVYKASSIGRFVSYLVLHCVYTDAYYVWI